MYICTIVYIYSITPTKGSEMAYVYYDYVPPTVYEKSCHVECFQCDQCMKTYKLTYEPEVLMEGEEEREFCCLDCMFDYQERIPKGNGWEDDQEGEE